MVAVKCHIYFVRPGAIAKQEETGRDLGFLTGGIHLGATMADYVEFKESIDEDYGDDESRFGSQCEGWLFMMTVACGGLKFFLANR